MIFISGVGNRHESETSRRLLNFTTLKAVKGDTALDRVDRETVSIAELYSEVDVALKAIFPPSRELWVRGEIQKISDATGHCYMDLVDPESLGERQAPTLKVKCWRSRWGSLNADLRAQGIFLEAGMTVVLRGSLDFYRVRAEVGFILADIDVTALLGKMALERAALLEALKMEGLLEAQRRREVPEVPLRIGLVGSPQTEGFNDFLGQLERSGFSFVVTVVKATVQGQHAPLEVARAINTLGNQEIDLICVVRGGGSKGDLVAFDSPEIARSIASCVVPIWTGIGHTGDESVADLVANARFITPTACGASVSERVGIFWGDATWAAGRIAQAATQTCERREQAYGSLRGQLVGSARGHLRQAQSEISHLRRRLSTSPLSGLRHRREALQSTVARLVPHIVSSTDRARSSIAAQRRLLAAYDPARNLERGWSLTISDHGQIIRSLDDVVEGAMISTRLVDGVMSSEIRSKEPRKK